MDFIKPVVVYTANGNLEAHSVVTWLESNGVASYAVEDNSGASLFAFGTISQFHKPQVFVDNTDMAGRHDSELPGMQFVHGCRRV